MALQTSGKKTVGIHMGMIDSREYQATSLLDDDDQQDEKMKWTPSSGCVGYAGLTSIEKITPEIVLTVVEFLSDADVVALALTSRTMFLKYLPKARLTPPERQQLLLRLEKELPQMYYCHGCVQLHRWRLSWYDLYKDEEACFASKPNWRPRKSYKDPSAMYHCPRTDPFIIPGRYAIPYHLARPIMNRRRYGSAHGPPEDVLDRSTKSAGKTDRGYGGCIPGIVESNLHTARIRDGQLIVYSVASVYHETQDVWRLLKYLNQTGVPVCRHLTTRHIGQADKMYEFNAGSAEILSRAVPITRSCYKCMTDYSIQVVNKDARGWIFTIRSWQSLGSVLSPSTWDWKHMTLNQEAMVMGTVEPRCREAKHDNRYGPGMVRSTYYSFDRVKEISDASFYPQGSLESLERYLSSLGHGRRSKARLSVKPTHLALVGDETLHIDTLVEAWSTEWD